MNMRHSDDPSDSGIRRLQRVVGMNFKMLAWFIAMALAVIGAWYTLKERVALLENDQRHLERRIETVERLWQ